MVATQAIPFGYVTRTSRHHGTRTRIGGRKQVRAAARVATGVHPVPSAVAGEKQPAIATNLLALVKRVAFEMRAHLPQHVEVDDLAGAGMLGLLDAINKFDVRKHTKMETYARHRIRGAILDSLRIMDTASRDMRKKNKAAEKVYHELEARHCRPVTDEEMAAAMGMSLRKWHRTAGELHTMGLEWMRPNLIPEKNLVDEQNIPAENQENQFDQCYRSEQREIVNRALSFLTDRERTVMTLYYEQEMTMKQIGDELGIDESRVSQVHSAALVHLKSKVGALMRPAKPWIPAAYMLADQGGVQLPGY
ncbi:MAG TPA: FliA/WhiG family RNA polymerase sigma factor [Terriglobia bacterium]|nr:FliA/WhiG family RNA polymerase sigma factor [Terriglobia bacterium]